MSVKSNVFASKAERVNFGKLSDVWGDKYRLYHNLPFLNVFDTHNLIDIRAAFDVLLAQANGNTPVERSVNIEISPTDLQRLKKTSIDYTLCDESGKPLVCIDFDGLQDGVNIGTEYVPREGYDKWRQVIMELKLMVAHGSLFPYFVVASSQFNNLSPDIRLTFVDGIIGDVLAGKATRLRLDAGFDLNSAGLSQSEFDALSPEEQHYLIEDWIWGIEIESDFDNNPISRKRMELQEKTHVTGWGHKLLYTEDVEESLARTVTQKERNEIINNARWIGHRTTVDTSDFGEVSGEAWLPNFQVLGHSSYGLLENISFIIAADRVLRRRGLKP